MAAPARETRRVKTNHTWRFWCVIAIISVALGLSSIEATIVGTALPTIIRMPTFAQISDTYGRRNPFLFALSSFVIGSAMSGTAKSMAMLIAGRALQGLGSGGIKVLAAIIISDLIPLREWGKYYAITFSISVLTSTLGPVFGGALADANWRWIFLLNLPPAAIIMVSLPFCLQGHNTCRWTWQQALCRVDWVGSIIFIPSVLAVLYSLITGGLIFPWSSYHVIIPLVFGLLGWCAFHAYQASPFCREQTMPPRVFKHRTAVAGYAMTFIQYFNINLLAYFMPIYFQAVHAASPTESGLYLLPLSIGSTIFAIIGGILLSRLGHYKQLHWCGFAVQTIGFGVVSTLDQHSTRARYAGLQLIPASSIGLILPTIIPPILASLPKSDTATANGVISFIREFAGIWGVTIPSILLNWQFNTKGHRIHDLAVRNKMSSGAAYAFSGSEFLSSLPLDTKNEVIGVYVDALRSIWWLAAGLSGLGFCLVFLERSLELQNDLDNEYESEERNQSHNVGIEDGSRSC